jgi:hypothetical protein
MAALGLVFAVAPLAPPPAAANHPRAEVIGQVQSRLPGWAIVKADAAWEGAWTVVAACGSRRLGFQVVPGHGLPAGYAWLQPADSYARSRLRLVSDHRGYLVWYPEQFRSRTLSCRRELRRG